MGEAKRQASRALRTAMALLLTALLVPVAAPSAARADEGTGKGEGANGDGGASIGALLDAGEYAEGEVLVAVDNAAARGGLRTRGIDILADAKPLMDASGEMYATATGEDLPLKEAPTDGPALLRSASALPAEDAVSMMLVEQEGASTEDLLQQLQNDPRVLFAEPNYVFTVSDPEREASEARMAVMASALGLGQQTAASGEESVGAAPAASGTIADLSSYQWSCKNMANTLVRDDELPLKDFDINPPLWNEPGKTNASGVVAVVDTGVDYDHPDLAGVMCNDMTRYSSRGGDHGFNALEGADPTNPMDDQFHGTHCAGVIAAEWNDEGISGVASGVELVAVKAGTAEGRFFMTSILAGYEYLAEAMDNGLPLKAVNNSWGNPGMSRSFSLAAAKLGEKGAVSIVASGNNATDLDKNPAIPSTLLGHPYAVVVDASTPAGTLAPFSNYGAETTNVVAPGRSILSTMPQHETKSYTPSYMPEADGQPLSFETFDSNDPKVKMYRDESQAIEIGDVARDTSRFDAVGGSLKVGVEKMPDRASASPSVSFKKAVVTIPVDASKQGEVAYVGMHLLTSPRKADAAYAEFKITKPGCTEDCWTTFGEVAAELSGGWGKLTADAQKLAQDENGELAFTDKGELQVRVTIARFGDAFGPDDTLYLDTVAVGKKDSVAAYELLDGTSMATPSVTGAAMVLAEQVSGQTAAERAAALAAHVKASVRPVGAFSGICTSGGQIDLGLSPSELVPVISNARVEAGTSPARIVIEGSHFGSTQGAKGQVTVAGQTAQVVSWSETSLTVECPSGVESGVLTVEVTAENGKSGKRGFLLELPETPGAGALPLYEKTIPLPTVEEGLDKSFMGGPLVGLGGSLYMLPTDGDRTVNSYAQLWRYDPDGSWTRCADLPEALDDNPSMTTYDGKLYLYAEKGADADASPRLLSYDPQADSWQTLSAANLPVHATIANCAGKLLLVGGATFVPDTPKGRWANKTDDNIAVLDPETGEVTAAGTLIHAVSTPVVTVRGTEIYVAQGDVFDSAGDQTSDKFERVTKHGGTYAGEDLTGALPPLDPQHAPQFAVAAAKDGPVITGFGGMNGQDTYLLDVAHGATAFQGLGKRISRAPLYFPSATAYDGWLYTLGLSGYEQDGRVLRATAMETLPQAGDGAPGPASPDEGDASTLAHTGDARGAVATALACTAAATAASAFVAARRRKRTATDRR